VTYASASGFRVNVAALAEGARNAALSTVVATAAAHANAVRAPSRTLDAR